MKRLDLSTNPAVNNSLIDISSISNTKNLVLQFTVSQWLKLCGLSLEYYNKTMFDYPGISYGKPYLRTTGLSIYIV